MDTVITMELRGPDAAEALSRAEAEIHRLDALLSIEGSGSEIAALNAGSSQFLSPEPLELLEAALTLSEATDGAFDCTIQPAAALWGWYGDIPAVPDSGELAEAMALVGYEGVEISGGAVTFRTDGMGVDLGGIGKGYAAGKLNTLLREAGITSGWISLGGNIRTIGAKAGGQPWIIGIADPDDPAAYRCTVAVTDRAVVTSGDYQRCFTQDGRRWHHILDPKTGWPAESALRSVTIVSSDDTLADGLSTALFVMGLEGALDFWRSGPYDFEAVFLTDGPAYVTEGLADGFTCQTDYEVVYR